MGNDWQQEIGVVYILLKRKAFWGTSWSERELCCTNLALMLFSLPLLQKIRSVDWFSVLSEMFRANFPETLEWQQLNHKEILRQKHLWPLCTHINKEALFSISGD
jgi:hypothetical protein